MRAALAVLTLASCSLAPARSSAQACCAGGAAMTPGRLELHDRALVGLQLRLASVLGSYDSQGEYRPNPSGAGELDAQQDLFASYRFVSRGQVSALLPLLQSWRSSATTGSEFGGGLGDLNLSARYDLVRNREFRYLPGVGVLAGVTLPTGRAPEAATQPLASDATGLGAFQFSLGLALERTFGSWYASVSGIIAQRTHRQVYGVTSALAPQFWLIAGFGYLFGEDVATIVTANYTVEGDASLEGEPSPDSGRRQLRLGLTGSWSVTEALRLQGTLSLDPPTSGVGQNQTATCGGTVGAIWSFR